MMLEETAIASVVIPGNLFSQRVIKCGFDFTVPIGVNVTLNELYYGHLHAEAGAWLIVEEGHGNVVIYPFDTVDACKEAAWKLWLCWVAYDRDAREIGSGGLGFTHNICRQAGAVWLSQNVEPDVSV